MAVRKPQMPSGRDLVKTPDDVAERWLDTMLREAEPPKDDAFETAGGGGPVMSATSSTNPSKPRTVRAGYDFEKRVLTVVFRDGTWWEYRDVPPDMWTAFKMADSKGKYLRESGLDNWGDMGPANVDDMPTHRRVQMASLSEFVEYMYGTKLRK